MGKEDDLVSKAFANGNSLALTIPSDLVKFFKVNVNDDFIFVPYKGKFIIVPRGVDIPP